MAVKMGQPAAAVTEYDTLCYSAVKMPSHSACCPDRLRRTARATPGLLDALWGRASAAQPPMAAHGAAVSVCPRCRRLLTIQVLLGGEGLGAAACRECQIRCIEPRTANPTLSGRPGLAYPEGG